MRQNTHEHIIENYNHDCGDNSLFYNESNEEIPPLPDLDDDAEGHSSSSVADNCSKILNLSSGRRFQSQSLLRSSSLIFSESTENCGSEIIKTSEETDNDFFFYDIEQETPSKDSKDYGNESSPRSTIPRVPLHTARSTSNLQNDASHNESSSRNKSSSLRRCQSQSILKTSSTYTVSPRYNLSDYTAELKPSTSFSTLEIREYPITLGDNPGGAQGPPISLGWKHNKRRTQVIQLEEYEDKRPQRRSRKEMHMADDIRRCRLIREKGVSAKDINKATKAANSVRRQRRKTIESQCGHWYSLKKRVGDLVSSITSPK